MDIRFIAIDLDDTLLTRNKRISRKNLEALDYARSKGAKIALCSGRTIEGMRVVMEQTGAGDYCICCGGAMLFDPQGKLLYQVTMGVDNMRAIAQYLHDYGIYYQVFVPGTFYYEKRTYRTDYYEDFCKFKGTQAPELANMELDATKIIAIGDFAHTEVIRKHIEQSCPSVKTFYTQKDFLEVFNIKVSKGDAVAHLAALLHIDAQQCMALGDSQIDIPMIEYCGVGVAMQNSTQDVIDCAAYVTADCDEDGVAQAIYKFMK